MSPEEVSGQGHSTRRYNLQPTSQENWMRTERRVYYDKRKNKGRGIDGKG